MENWTELIDSALFRSGDASRSISAEIRLVRDPRYIDATSRVWDFHAEHSNVAPPLFDWRSVFHFHPDALVFAVHVPLSAADGQLAADGAQALMQVTTERVVRCPNGVRGPLVYVGFIESAPWNRVESVPRGLRGLGPVLLRIAGDLASQNSAKGSVGLHSVKTAENFYRKLSFQMLDCPSEHHEVYCELDQGGVAALMQD